MTIARERPPWVAGFDSVDVDIPEPVTVEVSGDWPAEVAGSLFLVGPGRHEVAGSRNRDWFDGDGVVHAVRIRRGTATYQRRTVMTKKFRVESRRGRRVYATFGCRPAGGPVVRLTRPLPANPANRGVTVVGDRLLALWDAGPPWQLDPETLATSGSCRFDRTLGRREPYGPRPKHDRSTDELWNVGVAYGRSPALRITCCDTNRLRHVASVRLPQPAFIQDFALSARSVVVPVPPLALPRLPWRLLAGQRSYKESLRWDPDSGGRVVAIDRATGSLTWWTTPPLVVVSAARAFEDGPDLVLDVCAYDGPQFLAASEQVLAGHVETAIYPVLHRLRLHADGTVSDEPLMPLEAARPQQDCPVDGGEPLWALAPHPMGGFPGLPAQVRIPPGSVEWDALDADEYAQAPIPVGDRGWALFPVTRTAERRTEIRLYGADGPQAGAAATATLPVIVPFGCVGTWVPEAAA